VFLSDAVTDVIGFSAFSLASRTIRCSNSPFAPLLAQGGDLAIQNPVRFLARFAGEARCLERFYLIDNSVIPYIPVFSDMVCLTDSGVSRCPEPARVFKCLADDTRSRLIAVIAREGELWRPAN